MKNVMHTIFTKNHTDENAIHGWRNVIRGCHPWMEKCHPWMKVYSVDVIYVWRRRMMDMDMDGAIDVSDLSWKASFSQ